MKKKEKIEKLLGELTKSVSTVKKKIELAETTEKTTKKLEGLICDINDAIEQSEEIIKRAEEVLGNLQKEADANSLKTIDEEREELLIHCRKLINASSDVVGENHKLKAIEVIMKLRGLDSIAKGEAKINLEDVKSENINTRSSDGYIRTGLDE